MEMVKKIKNIVFCGGGSGGHVMPALTLIRSMSEYHISYIGGRNGIERELALETGIPYYSIFTGKLRRYLSFENLIDFFKIFFGLFQSVIILFKFNRKNTLVFSTGGFVSVPVVIAAWLTRKMVFIHEQTSRVGLANKIASRFADKIFISFKGSMLFFPAEKIVFSGYPLRNECFISKIGHVVIDGTAINEIKKPILFVTGGGNGSGPVNELVRSNMEKLKDRYFIIHQVGKKFLSEYEKYRDDNYIPVSFIKENMIDIFKLSKVILSRAGAGTVSELMALGKKTIFIPLKIAQKNEQYHNAMEAKNKIGSTVIEEDQLENCDIMEIMLQIESANDQQHITSKTETFNAVDIILKEIKSSGYSHEI